MDIYYVNSKGVRLDFTQWPYMVNETSLYDYTWACITDSKEITGLEKGSAEYQVKLAITADTSREFQQAVNHLTETIEYDVLREQPGRLYCGEYYMNGYFVASTKLEWNKGIEFMFNTLTFATGYPVWIKESTFLFNPGTLTSHGSGTFLDYPVTYPYDYTLDASPMWLHNNHYAECEFEMIIYGPCVNPAININGHIYQVFTTVASEEYLKISSKQHTVEKIQNDGRVVNEYNNRGREFSLFKKLPTGSSGVSPNGSFNFDITIFETRSEPKWTWT